MKPCWLFALLCAGTSTEPGVDPPPPAPDHTHLRAGFPQCLSSCARPALSPKETGGWVGGGCLFHGEPSGPCDGTWGWDYVGHGKHPGRVFLKWCGCDSRKPAGPYKIDGPHVPDVFAAKPIKRAVEKCRENQKE